ncbi:hypothetical protein D9758_014763 [Tetrapyrgos nigripes]|uniref:Myb/SANT-like domain-containing protein n=1 Tax=Tetrapyrgos nigripes TaxID=182062 RepID=A0A8H5FFT4_9AGAR|nr:hypothetical protein D9758_014763 [Tetrapyrgos nigripes]
MQAKWSNSDVDIMIDKLKNQKAQGNQSQSGWKPDTWTTVSKRIIAEGSQEGAKKNPKKCSDKYGTLKAQYKVVHYIRTKASGFGWDEQKQMVVATDEWWDRHLDEELIEWPSSPPASAPPPSSNSNLTVLASVSAAVPITTPARKRLRADSDPFTPPKSQKRGKGDQLSDIASGLHSIGQGLAANEPTPKR